MQIAPPSDPGTGTSHSDDVFPRGQTFLFAAVTVLFFLWGMSNNLTDILVQQFRKSFVLSALQAQLVQTAVFFGYFCMALPAATLMRRRGYKTGIVAGLCLFGAGTLMFWPAAVIERYWLMLLALFFVGCGSATLETAANPFIARFGPAQSSERRLNFAQTFNPLGTISGVLVGTYFIFSGVELPPARIAAMKSAGTYAAYLHGEIMRVVPTYVTLGAVVLLLAVVIGRTGFPAMAEDDDPAADGTLGSQIGMLLRRPALRAAVVAQFCYCGAQVSTWSSFIPYARQYTATTERSAALMLTGTLVALFLGRLVSTALMRAFAPVRMMTLYAAINIALVAVGILLPGRAGLAALLLSSFFMSIMFPTIFALGVKDLGPLTKLGGSLIVMAVVGGAVVPPLLGQVAGASGSYALGYTLVALCYAVVLVYGLQTHRRLTRSPQAPSVV